MNEDSVREEISFDNLIFPTTRNDSAVEKDHTEKAEAEADMHSLKEQLCGLAVVKAVFAHDVVLSREREKLILDRQRALRLERQVHLRQSSISDHLKF